MSDLHGKLSVKRLFGLVNIGEGRPRGDLQAKTITPTRSQQVVTPDSEYYGLSHVTVEAVTLQDKTVAPGTSAQIVEPDEGYAGLDSVTVAAAPLQQKTVTPEVGQFEVTPDAGFYGLEKVTVKETPLQEFTIVPGSEKVELTPDPGYIGFSKVIVEGVDFDGGGGSGGGNYPGGDFEGWEPAEDETFGDDYYAPTGNYDYSAGADDTPSYIPEIPGEGYKALFSKQLKAGKAFRYSVDGISHDLRALTDVTIYAAAGSWMADGGKTRYDSCQLFVYSGAESAYYSTKLTTTNNWPDNTVTQKTEQGYFGTAHFSTNTRREEWGNDLTTDIEYDISGVILHRVGMCADLDSYLAAARAYATSPESEEMGSDQFIAFVSDAQILYDGSVINNTDTSPMTIYECNASDKNTWSEIGKTDGTDYPVGGYTLIWNSHDLKDMEGLYVTQSKSDDPIAEMGAGVIGTPVERNETYTIEGSTVNKFVGAAQRVTGGKTPLSPTDAAQALDEYYNHPAEEGKW